MKSLLFSFMLIASFSSAQAAVKRVGGHDGGGGQGVVCYNPQGEIESVELLDFYEGQLMEGLQVGEFSGTPVEIAEKALERFSDFTQRLHVTKKTLSRIMDSFKFLAPGVRLKEIEDGNVIYRIPKGCVIEQIANFQGLGRIFIVKDFWDKMDSVRRAGLLVHEYLWFVERGVGVKHSGRVKLNVARIFAENFELDVPEKLSESIVSCGTDNPLPTLFRMSEEGEIYIHLLAGEAPLVRYHISDISGAQGNTYTPKEFADILLNSATDFSTFPWGYDFNSILNPRFYIYLKDSANNSVATLEIDIVSPFKPLNEGAIKIRVNNHFFEGLGTEERSLHCHLER